MEEQVKTGDLGKYRNGSHYRQAFKIKVLEDLVSNNESEAYIARKHGIPAGSLWNFRQDILKSQGYYRILESMNKDRQSGDLSKDEEIAELKKALKLSTMKVAALETLIDVVDDQLNIDIRKKGGSKQSK